MQLYVERLSAGGETFLAYVFIHPLPVHLDKSLWDFALHQLEPSALGLDSVRGPHVSDRSPEMITVYSKGSFFEIGLPMS